MKNQPKVVFKNKLDINMFDDDFYAVLLQRINSLKKNK